MPTRGWALSAVCFLVGAACFISLPWVLSLSQYRYWIEEPHYSNPVPTQFSTIPIRNDEYGKGYYGASRNGGRKHQGIDFLVKVGEPIFASKSGRVSYAGVDEGYGNYIELSHPDGFSTRYAHLSQSWVSTGDWVWQGAVIGRSGRTGNASHRKILPHLHFEIRYFGKPLNPAAGWLSPSLRYE